MQPETLDTPIEYHAAMFRALGRQTRMSRSGCSIVFARDALGRRDLSGDAERAAAQLAAAGIDVAGVTAEDVLTYRTWYDRMYNTRRVDQARILITRPFGFDQGRERIAVNRVTLIDGWGIDKASEVVICEEFYNRAATDRMGNPGAYSARPNYPVIESVIASYRASFPEFADAPVADNNLREPRAA